MQRMMIVAAILSLSPSPITWASGTLQLVGKAKHVRVYGSVGLRHPRGHAVRAANESNKRRIAAMQGLVDRLAARVASRLRARAKRPRIELALTRFEEGFRYERRASSSKAGRPILVIGQNADVASAKTRGPLYLVLRGEQRIVLSVARLPKAAVLKALPDQLARLVALEGLLFRLEGATDSHAVYLLSRYGAKVSQRALRKRLGAPRWKTLQVLALHRALQMKDEKQARALLDAGIDPNARNRGRYNDVPLHQAAEHGLNKIVALLIKKGAKVDAKNEFDRTPLFSAIRAGHQSCVRHLLKAGADVNYVSQRYWTPLHAAVGRGDPGLVKQLLRAGAKLRPKGLRPGAKTAAEIAKKPAIRALFKGR